MSSLIQPRARYYWIGITFLVLAVFVGMHFYRQRIEAIMVETGANLVLADATRVIKTRGISEMFGFVVKHTAQARGAALTIAVVPSAASHSDYAFMETAARNRGWKIRLFESRREAIRWLKDS